MKNKKEVISKPFVVFLFININLALVDSD